MLSPDKLFLHVLDLVCVAREPRLGTVSPCPSSLEYVPLALCPLGAAAVEDDSVLGASLRSALDVAVASTAACLGVVDAPSLFRALEARRICARRACAVALALPALVPLQGVASSMLLEALRAPPADCRSADRSAALFGDARLRAATVLLLINPFHQTAWNVRRRDLLGRLVQLSHDNAEAEGVASAAEPHLAHTPSDIGIATPVAANSRPRTGFECACPQCAEFVRWREGGPPSGSSSSSSPPCQSAAAAGVLGGISAACVVWRCTRIDCLSEIDAEFAFASLISNRHAKAQDVWTYRRWLGELSVHVALCSRKESAEAPEATSGEKDVCGGVGLPHSGASHNADHHHTGAGGVGGSSEPTDWASPIAAVMLALELQGAAEACRRRPRNYPGWLHRLEAYRGIYRIVISRAGSGDEGLKCALELARQELDSVAPLVRLVPADFSAWNYRIQLLLLLAGACNASKGKNGAAASATNVMSDGETLGEQRFVALLERECQLLDSIVQEFAPLRICQGSGSAGGEDDVKHYEERQPPPLCLRYVVQGLCEAAKVSGNVQEGSSVPLDVSLPSGDWDGLASAAAAAPGESRAARPPSISGTSTVSASLDILHRIDLALR